MASFAEFISSIQAEGIYGKAFDRFCHWFLLNDPIWKTQLDKASMRMMIFVNGQKINGQKVNNRVDAKNCCGKGGKMPL